MKIYLGQEDATTKAGASTATQSKADADKAYKMEAKRKRDSRVIVRNLSFYANEQHVRTIMEQRFGPVAAVDLPLVPSPPDVPRGASQQQGRATRHRGFAFVTFANAGAARRAVEGGGDVEVKGRAVAIDYSVSKKEHQRVERERRREGHDLEGENADSSDSKSDEDASGDHEQGTDVSDDSDDGENDESSDERSDEDSGHFDLEEDGNDADGKEEKTQPSFKEDVKDAPDFDETEAACTLFLRNLPFDATRHDVFELFRKFGRIASVHLVKDGRTGAFRGTAFVRFDDENGCAAALQAAGDGGKLAAGLFVSAKNAAIGLGQGDGGSIHLKGRRVLIDRAVDRTTASALAVGNGWPTLITPALLVGNLGYALATPLGMLLHAAFRAMGQRLGVPG